MSQRTAKVESLVHQTVASELPQLMTANLEKVTVTRVDVAPDLRNAAVWISVRADDDWSRVQIFDQVLTHRPEIQRVLARQMTTKFIPKLTFKLDTGADHAEHISRLLKDL